MPQLAVTANQGGKLTEKMRTDAFRARRRMCPGRYAAESTLSRRIARQSEILVVIFYPVFMPYAS